MKLQFLPETLSICKMEPNVPIPEWATKGRFFGITKTADELSIVCEQTQVPNGIKSENDWNAFRVVGNLDFSLTGILVSIATPLAVAKVSLFAISTFDTDYILIKKVEREKATWCLQKNGFIFI